MRSYGTKATRLCLAILSLSLTPAVLGTSFSMTECGGDTAKEAPKFKVFENRNGFQGARSDLCGDFSPEIDLKKDDPFNTERYRQIKNDTVPPFQACQQAYQEMMNSRPLCDSVAKDTYLVTKLGSNDPRWNPLNFKNYFNSIQSAVNAAKHCDVIIVRPGVYKEYIKIAGKDVKIFSDTWDESGTVNDGNQYVSNYVAEKINLALYYNTGNRVVEERRTPYRKPLKRSVRTIIEGGGYAEGPTLGGRLADDHSSSNPNRGCGNRRPMVDFVAGTTRSTELDGFSIRLMPEQDHTMPGHGHTLQLRGGSPIIRNNIIYNNGSTGIGIHANFVQTSAITPPCEVNPELAQETFKNDDYRTSNIQFRPVPLVYGNISYQNNGLGMGNNHYSCAAMVANEVFWNVVPGEEDTHQSPGIGSRHGAKTCIDLNVSYENGWVGIGVNQGELQPAGECAVDPEGCNHINERTRAIISRNIVFDNGAANAPQNVKGGIGVDGVGTPEEPTIIKNNITFRSALAGIGIRNEFSGRARGYVGDHTYVKAYNNVSFANEMVGVGCTGSNYGMLYCDLEGNEAFWNKKAGIAYVSNVSGQILQNVAACNIEAGIQTFRTTTGFEYPVYNNIAWANGKAGIINTGSHYGYNIYAANNGQDIACTGFPAGFRCQGMQQGLALGGSAGENNLFLDPQFVSYREFNFSLLPSSPGFDSGFDISIMSPRPYDGSNYNIGSREF